MSKGVKTFIAVAAAIAIPFAAPVIAKSIGLSTIIGAAAANVAVGATLGAATAKVTGGDPLMGAVSGGVGGYFGGGGGDIFAGPTAAPAGGAAGGTGITAGASGASGISAPSATLPASAVTAPTFAPVDYSLAAGMGGTAAVTGIGSGITIGAPGVTGITAPTYDIGAALSGGTPVDYSLAAGSTPSVGLQVPSYAAEPFQPQPTAGAPLAPPVATTAPGMGGATGSGVSPAMAPPALSPTPATAATAPAGAPKTFAEAIRGVPGAIADKFKDPKVLADLTLRAAGQLAGAALAGDGLSDEERQLLAAERSDLERLRGENETLFRERLSAAQNLIGESRYFDPEYFGLQRARQAQIAGARSKRAGLRGLRGRQRDVAERQFDIETARTTGSAYDVGAQAATTGRLQTQQAGLSLMPSTFPSVSYAGLRGVYDTAAQRRSERQTGIGKLFGTLIG